MSATISYKSFCWSLGTTSFRKKNFNKTIEEQLVLLDGFWKLPENKNCSWEANTALQSRYYDYMKKNGFVVGDADNKPKDAREKTSGLEDIGLLDKNRRLTNAGKALLEVCNANNFTSDNFFKIPKDSYIYLKQLLKTSNSIDGNIVRPFIVLLYVLSQVNELSLDEFSYLLPLCTNNENTQNVIDGIKALRTDTLTIDDIIIDRLMSMGNYQAALTLLLDNNVDENLLCKVGFNRKSRSYDKPYFPLYQNLYSAYINDDAMSFAQVYTATTKMKKIGQWWRSYLFNTSSYAAIKKDPLNCINHTLFDSVTNENEFKTVFFKVMHLFKAKATLSDYFDLNRRYIKITDVVLFEDDTVKLDIVPKHFFNSVIDELYNHAYVETKELYNDCAINNIACCLNINEQTVIKGVNAELGENVTTIEEANAALEKQRYTRLQHLIDTKFTDNQILTLLDCFEKRDDKNIEKMVIDSADIPTIFEYVLAIIWYKISECQGKILDYMKLSLNADLFPKTHAAGGEADIVYEYEATEHYPLHVLLIEATLADSTNQRRMEMEPVSRHLGKHLLKTKNFNSYCVFVSPYLDINVISDFRSRKAIPFYNSQDCTEYVEGMKIIPLRVSEIKKIIKAGKKYNDLYTLFETAFNSKLPPHMWYENCIKNLILH